MRAGPWLSVVLVLLACSPSGPPPRPGQADKQALYGDPGLIPTREGERARRELMLAGELERLLERAAIQASVTVSLARDPGAGGSALVVARAREATEVQTIARAALSEREVATIEVVLAPTDEPPEVPPRGPLLAVAIGLGLALGVALERLRTRVDSR